MDPSLLAGESKTLEYKRDFTKTLLKTVSAFANYHDGCIIIGIDDHKQIVGVEQPEEVKLNIENSINDSLEPKPYFELRTEIFQGKQLVVVTVYKGDHTPYTLNQKAYKRLDTSTVQVDRFGYEALILSGRNQGYDGLTSERQDLRFSFLESKLKASLGIGSLTEDLLITLGLKANGKYNNGAVLLSDQHSIQSADINLIAYRGDNVMAISDRVNSSGESVLKQFEVCMDFYRKHINVMEIIEGAYRKTVEEVPLVAYREAVANMIVHRDYLKNIAARIEIFSNRIEVVSPGGLPIGILEEEYLEGRISMPRNRIIADLFLRLKIIEKLATGIRRIKEYYQDYEVKPQFKVTENSITVILPMVNQAGFVPGAETLEALNSNERMIYNLLKMNSIMTRSEIELKLGLKKSQTVELLAHLRELKLVAQVGGGRTTAYKLIE